MQQLKQVEAWARRGTADDMAVLVKLFACLEPELRRQLLSATAGIRPGRHTGADPQSCKATSEDALGGAVILLDSYAANGAADKSELLAAAAKLVASMRMKQSLPPSDMWADEHQWLCALARDTRPCGDEAA
jgi:hypothetical protein